MATKIKYTNDVTKAEEEMQGSDGRANVSSRADSRGYYNSRDEQLTFSLVWGMTQAASGEFVAYWRNASATKTLVISSVGLNAEEAMSFKLHFVTGTAIDGTELTPLNSNKASSNAAPDDAAVMAMEGTVTTPIGGLTTAGTIDHAVVSADGHEELRLGDRIRLGQNAAIAISAEDTDGSAVVFGVIFGYYE